MTSPFEFSESDEHSFAIAAQVERFGFVMQTVEPGRCSAPACLCYLWPYNYAYSIGLCRLGHPEIVVFGLEEDDAHNIAHVVHDPAADGQPLAIGRDHRHAIGGGLTVALDPVPELWARRDPSRIAGWWRQYGRRRRPEFVQVAWSDDLGRMPWDDEFAPDLRRLQPLLAVEPIDHPPPLNRAQRRRRR